MKTYPLWIVVVIAVVSFTAGMMLKMPWEKPTPLTGVAISSPTSRSRNVSEVPSESLVETDSRSRGTGRDFTKKTSEPQISIPLSNLTQTLEDIFYSSEFDDLGGCIAKALVLLDVPQSEKDAMNAMILKVESEIHEKEKTCLKADQISDTEIKIDHTPMEAYSKTIPPKIQDGIRSLIRADLADALISSIKWDEFYPVDEKTCRTFSITRSKSGRLSARVSQPDTTLSQGVPEQFVDDGIPIPADQAFRNERWQRLLKGLTLLPQDEK